MRLSRPARTNTNKPVRAAGLNWPDWEDGGRGLAAVIGRLLDGPRLRELNSLLGGTSRPSGELESLHPPRRRA